MAQWPSALRTLNIVVAFDEASVLRPLKLPAFVVVELPENEVLILLPMTALVIPDIERPDN